MDNQNAVTLSVNGLDYRGWKKVSISAGIERQARDFRLGVTWSWPGQVQEIPVRQGDRCEVRIGADLVLTGWVFATPISYDAHSVERSVAGRSLTADLVDCSAVNKPGQWRGQSVQKIVQALAEPYGVRVLSEVAETTKLADHQIEPGETAFESIDRLLTLSRLLSTDDARGRVVIIKPGSAGRAVDRLELGQNLLTGSAELDFSGVFSEYRVTGQRSGTDTDYGAAASEVKAGVTDPRATRRRVLLIHESGQMTPELAQARANWERGSRMGKALTLRYKIQGWRQSTGALWVPNMTVRVVDPLIGIDRDMLISEIEYVLDDAGTVANIVVGPPDGFDPEPKDPHKSRKLKKRGKADNFEYLIPADWKPGQ
ncbi:contractile injection system protein, VgrG/Pvc8 family [Pseudomonas peradeniyensis]|uniref:phage baseplate assembly protein n=1 Tax=Pseudomonas peradeniyensis TaxID=2745488 RepID=UPI0021D4C215|nr:contractile injection system protein, VgrG/Pvc8 family [Pseudomonas peradeniyensis]MCU7281704.1 contractile injection system protein, VgrG/Pvc8 family [Pseudomonas peradeniyensis]